ncbi:DUF4142 domain-containing protein [Streptomyces sp. RB6PN25]|uniref:DUF4142 domain-containing protein n=1 Tax=Streptomyces humicola TaxID=2953240 RepID=A0ABT1PQ44_9ACTN|nr:DUF4142 domain-containing protein [Streptomyces humicola]MCQ4079801.1 DUF4142 domain-containing protein [Streptomyces humicola]
MSVTRCGAVCAVLCLSGAGALQAPASAASRPEVSSSRMSPSQMSAVDTQLLTAAHQGNLWEIATGQDARTDATTSCVKEVSAVFVRDHRTLDAGVAEAAKQVGLALPALQSPGQAQQRAALRTVAGKRSYDTQWLRAQYTAHVQTLALIDKELASGTSPVVKALAKGARPVVVQHTQMVLGGVCHGKAPAGSVNAGAAGSRLAAAAYGPQDSTAAAAFAGVLLGGSGVAWVARRRRSSRR